MSADQKDEGFLDRWSKRKQAVKQEAPEAQEAVAAEVIEPEPETDEQALEVLRERDPELADQVSAIDIDALTYDDDFSIFMNKKVPEFLRRKALSKLWLSSPILANVDGLNDYDEDFRDAGSVIEAVQTALNRDDADSGNGEIAAENPAVETVEDRSDEEIKPVEVKPENQLAEERSDAESGDADQDEDQA